MKKTTKSFVLFTFRALVIDFLFACNVHMVKNPFALPNHRLIHL